MTEQCALCGEDLNPFDISSWKEVKGWVGGPRKDSMRLRENTGRFAHDRCVAKVQSGQAPDQPTLDEYAIIRKSSGKSKARTDPVELAQLEDLLDSD